MNEVFTPKNPTEKTTPSILLYDGSCPFCESLSDYYRLRTAFKEIKLVSMRDGQEVKKLNLDPKLDLNNGMVLLTPDGKIRQGKDAFRYLSLALDGWNPLNFFLQLLSKNDVVLAMAYPLFKLGRRLALLFKGVPHRL